MQFKKHCFLFLILISTLSFSKEAKLILGIPPWGGSKEENNKRFQPLIEYLSENLSREVVFTVSSDYDELGNDIDKCLVNFAIISSSAYVKAKAKYPSIQYLCSPLTKDGHHSYESYIITRKDSGIKNYSDLKGKLFAFVDESSSSGYKFPLTKMIKEWKINPDDYFKKVLFLGSHPNVVSAIYNKKADAGAVYESWRRDVALLGKDEIAVIDLIENIPRDGVVVCPSMDTETKTKLKNLLLNLNSETKTKSGKKIIETLGWGGFVEKSDSYYDIIRETDKIISEYNIQKK